MSDSPISDSRCEATDVAPNGEKVRCLVLGATPRRGEQRNMIHDPLSLHGETSDGKKWAWMSDGGPIF